MRHVPWFIRSRNHLKQGYELCYPSSHITASPQHAYKILPLTKVLRGPLKQCPCKHDGDPSYFWQRAADQESPFVTLCLVIRQNPVGVSSGQGPTSPFLAASINKNQEGTLRTQLFLPQTLKRAPALWLESIIMAFSLVHVNSYSLRCLSAPSSPTL